MNTKTKYKVIFQASVLIFVLAFGCSSAYANMVSFTNAPAWSISPDGVMDKVFNGPPAGAATVSLEYGSSTPFLLYGGWGVDTPYQKYTIRLGNISQDELHVGAAIRLQPTSYNHLDVEVTMPVFSGTPDVIYTPVPYSEPFYYVYPDECTQFITNSGWLADGLYPNQAWHSSYCGFYISPQPGQSYTESFSLYMSVGTCLGPIGGIGAEVGWQVTYNFIVEPEPIPAPSAVILGSLGLTFSGWLLRKRRMI